MAEEERIMGKSAYEAEGKHSDSRGIHIPSPVAGIGSPAGASGIRHPGREEMGYPRAMASDAEHAASKAVRGIENLSCRQSSRMRCSELLAAPFRGVRWPMAEEEMTACALGRTGQTGQSGQSGQGGLAIRSNVPRKAAL
jgi:hypothetical protein